jgi:superfamily I DNA/RNA helicase
VQIINREGTDYLRQLLSSVSDEAQADYVVSTVHRAKGLEWDRVKVAGDFRFKPEDDGRISMADDEKRLLYVALTRARRLLELSELRADLLKMFLDSTGARRPFAAGGYARVEWLVIVGLRPLKSRRLSARPERCLQAFATCATRPGTTPRATAWQLRERSGLYDVSHHIFER